MSRDALKDAFIAGWYVGQAGGESAIADFNLWYTNTLETLNRATSDFQMKAGHFYETVCGNRVGPMAWVDDNLWTSMQIGNRRNWRDDGTCINCTEMNIVRDSTHANLDGWIEWDGSADMPPGLSGDTMVDVRFGSGTIDRVDAGFLYWGRDIDGGAAVTAYRVVTR